MKKLTLRELLFQIVLVTIMLLIAVVTLYPMWFVFVASFSNNTEVIKSAGMMFWFKEFTFAAYKEVLGYQSIWTGYRNTLFVVLGGTLLSIILTSMGGYVLSRKNVMWKKLISTLIIFTMYFSGGLIPRYFLIKSLHIESTLLVLILPVAINTYNMIIMRSAFESVPQSLYEAAQIDGAGHFVTLFQIMLPVVKATIAVLILYYAVGYWNAWFDAMIFINERTKQPLQLILREIVLYNTTSDSVTNAIDRAEIGETVQYATIIVATLPILVLYPFLQKYFTKGVMIGAVKG